MSSHGFIPTVLLEPASCLRSMPSWKYKLSLSNSSKPSGSSRVGHDDFEEYHTRVAVGVVDEIPPPSHFHLQAG